MPRRIPSVVHFCVCFLSYDAALVEVVSFLVEVLFAELTGQVRIIAFPNVEAETSEEIKAEEVVGLAVTLIIPREVQKSLAEFTIKYFFYVVFAIRLKGRNYVCL